MTFPVAGKDRAVSDGEIVVYTPEYYKAKPTFKNGVDVYVVDGKVAVINDRAGRVYQQNKPDPGPLAIESKGFVLSAQGAARKWLLIALNFALSRRVCAARAEGWRRGGRRVPAEPARPAFVVAPSSLCRAHSPRPQR